MEQWLSQMETLRRRLHHFGKGISGEDYAETLLGHVSRTHREVVLQFSKHYIVRDGVTVRPVPTSAQVINALMAESALDERVANEEETKPAHICSCGNQPQSESQKLKPQQNQGKGKQQKGKGRYKAKPKQGGQQQERRLKFTHVISVAKLAI
ncbi:hypothetical protein PI126_g20023 [Phytophthora idaei]|nr:hypothetical protein PI126_g20023 [Phytophthora idaei]